MSAIRETPLVCREIDGVGQALSPDTPTPAPHGCPRGLVVDPRALKQTFTGSRSLASFRATAARRTAGCKLSSRCAASDRKWAGVLAYDRGNKNATRRIAPAHHRARHRLRIPCGSAQPQRSQGGVMVWPNRLTAPPISGASPNRRDPGRSSHRRSDQVGGHRHGWLVRATCGGRRSHAVSLPDQRRCT